MNVQLCEFIIIMTIMNALLETRNFIIVRDNDVKWREWNQHRQKHKSIKIIFQRWHQRRQAVKFKVVMGKSEREKITHLVPEGRKYLLSYHFKYINKAWIYCHFCHHFFSPLFSHSYFYCHKFLITFCRFQFWIIFLFKNFKKNIFYIQQQKQNCWNEAATETTK